jgi:hypothetical protein
MEDMRFMTEGKAKVKKNKKKFKLEHENCSSCGAPSCGVVFSYKGAYPKEKYYTGCKVCIDTKYASCITSGLYKVVATDYFPKKKKIESIVTEIVPESGLNLYHMIYKNTPKSLNFVTFGKTEEDAKKRILDKYECDMDSTFRQIVLDTKINLVSDNAVKLY